MFAGQCSRTTARAKSDKLHSPPLQRTHHASTFAPSPRGWDLDPNSVLGGTLGADDRSSGVRCSVPLGPCHPPPFACCPCRRHHHCGLGCLIYSSCARRLRLVDRGRRLGSAQCPSDGAGPGGHCVVVSPPRAPGGMDPHHGGARNTGRPGFKAHSGSATASVVSPADARSRFVLPIGARRRRWHAGDGRHPSDVPVDGTLAGGACDCRVLDHAVRFPDLSEPHLSGRSLPHRRTRWRTSWERPVSRCLPRGRTSCQCAAWAQDT